MMNWPRIWIGSGLAALLLFLLDVFTALGARHYFGAPQTTLANLFGWLAMSRLLPDLIVGFLVCWLYVLARPRLGPGPKTALVMGSIAFALSYQQLLSPVMWREGAAMAAVSFLLAWVKFVMATYVAGWQYIERAP